MRGLPSTVALLLVFVGLGAYIYFGGARNTGDGAAEQERIFASLDTAQIAELKVKSQSGDVTTLRKEGDAWKIVEPIAAPAAEGETAAIVNALGSMQIVRVVDENPAEVKTYGLETPRIEIEFKTADGKTTGHLYIGDKTATAGNLYARRDDQKRVLLIADYHEFNLNKGTFDLRDKAIVKFDRSKVDGVDVNVGGTAIEFAKADAEWKMVKPFVARADFSAVEGLVGRVETTQMKSVASTTPAPADLKKFGFDKPQVTVNLHLGSARATLIIGGKEGDATVYARDASKPDVVVVDTGATEEFKKPADDYRKKELFDFKTYTATRVEITRSGQTVTFERVKAKDEKSQDTWHRVSPTPGDPDREKVDSFLAGMADLRATSFVPSKTNTGLESPVMTVVAKFDEGKKEERVTFGRSGSDLFGSRPDDPGAARIDTAKFDETVKALDELSK